MGQVHGKTQQSSIKHLQPNSSISRGRQSKQQLAGSPSNIVFSSL
jgi:hypothetical protein